MRAQFITAAAILGCALNVPAFSQSPSTERLTFEVASIKPHNPDDDRSSWSNRGGRQTFVGTTTSNLITSAFRVNPYELIGGPSWIETDLLDVLTKTDSAATPAQLEEMMRSLLEERFALQVHEETRRGAKYRLALARKDGKPGDQLIRTPKDCTSPEQKGQCGMRMSANQMEMWARPFSDFVRWLESQSRRRIIDETGLSGTYDIKLSWSRNLDDTTRPSFSTALQEQLGLKLEPTEGPVRVLVIDHIERPSPD